MLIVEGPDGSGKTTLVQHLAEIYNLPVAPRVVDKDTRAMVDLKKWTEDNVLKPHEDTIYDRHRLISELIYGPVLRHQPEPGFDSIKWVVQQTSALYNRVRPLIIYCLPPFETVLENLKKGQDNEFIVNSGQTRTIYNLYHMRCALDAAAFSNQIMLYDYTHPGADGMMEAIYYCVSKEIQHGN